MKLLSALIYMGFGMWILFQVVEEPPFWLGITVWFLLMFSSVVIFNEGFIRKLKRQTDKEYMKELLDKGKAKKETYNVDSALYFDDLNTGCAVHLLDIGNNQILCLYGQYLYDFEPINDDPEINQPRKFPTKEFSQIKRLKDNYILELIPGNEVVEPKIIKEPKIEEFYKLNPKLIDGKIINKLSFKEALSLVQ
ncbi:MAG: hypothetical protein ABIK92_01745 [Pseudomonadota bacterium]